MKDHHPLVSQLRESLQRHRQLHTTMKIGQVLGAVLGYLFSVHEMWFLSLWIGGAALAFPAFLVGLGIQSRCDPQSVAQYKDSLWPVGLISFGLTVSAPFVAMMQWPSAQH